MKKLWQNEKLDVKFSSFFLPKGEKDSITYQRRGVEKFGL
jgi:hypothetical protein